MAMPFEKAYEMINKLSGVEALFVMSGEDEKSQYRIVETSGFPQ
jgi:hypothetical protein